MDMCISQNSYDTKCLSNFEFEAWAICLWDAWTSLSSKRVDGISFLKSLVGERDWKPPDKGKYIIDVDAAFNPTSKRYGTGAVIRDHEGKIIAVAGRPLLLPKSVLGAEIMAILDGPCWK